MVPPACRRSRRACLVARKTGEPGDKSSCVREKSPCRTPHVSSPCQARCVRQCLHIEALKWLHSCTGPAADAMHGPHLAKRNARALTLGAAERRRAFRFRHALY